MHFISPKLNEVIGVKRNFGVPSPAIVTASYDGKPIVAFDHQHFMAIDFGSDPSCNLSSCTENDQSKLELFFYTEETFDGFEPNPNTLWSVTDKNDSNVIGGVLEKPLPSEGKSYLHYLYECINPSSCLNFQVWSFEEKQGNPWRFEQISHRVSIDNIIYSDNELTFSSEDYYADVEYLFPLGKCDATTICSEGESLFDTTILSSSTDWDPTELSLNGFFFDERRSKESGSMMNPISMNRHVQAFMLDKRQPSTKYRNLRCVQTEDSCVGVAMIGWKAKDYIDSGRIAVSVTVDDVALDPSGPRPCEPDTLNSCNTYYTTETVGNCQTSLSEQISSPGAIAGITIGCVVFVVLIAGFIYYQDKKRKGKQPTKSVTAPEVASGEEPTEQPAAPSESNNKGQVTNV